MESNSENLFRRELLRKALHLPLLTLPLIIRWQYYLPIFLLSSIILLYLFERYQIIHKKSKIPLLSTLVKKLKRDYAWDLGPVYLALGSLVLIYFCDEAFFYLGILSLAISDSAASLVGRKFARIHFKKFNKSLEGSTAFFITSLIICLYLFDYPTAIFYAASLTLVELVSIRGFDNLMISLFILALNSLQTL